VIFFLIVLLALAIGGVWNRPAVRVEIADARRWLHRSVPYGCAPAALVALVFSFAGELESVQRINASLFARAAWDGRLPLSVMITNPPALVPDSFRYAFVLVARVQALLLGVYLAAMHDRPWRRVDTIASTCAALAIVFLALASPGLTSFDMYAYVADSLLGSRAYDPPLTHLRDPFAIIHHMWFYPLYPAAYGPIWLWWNHAVLGLVQGLYPKLLMLRLENVLALALALGSLRRLGAPAPLVAATAVNPAIAFYFISNGHNDLAAIAVVLAAMTIAPRLPVAAGVIAGIGASEKLTLIVPAAAVALVIATRAKRFAYVAVMAATAGAIAFFLGGRPYLHALAEISAKYAYFNSWMDVRIVHYVTAIATIAVTVVAIVFRRPFFGAGFGFVSLAQAFFPWYAIWGLPYVAARTGALAALVVGLPVMTALLDVPISAKRFALAAVLTLMVLVVVRTVRRSGLAREPAEA
jgi:hypothetical protein